MTEGMAGSILGVWVAHGEGRFHAEDSVIDVLSEGKLLPIRYTDHQGSITEQYPYNPNGSPQGIAAICSPDGRHLAMMPHPERTFQTRQWSWMNEELRKFEASPWSRFFYNAYRAFI